MSYDKDARFGEIAVGTRFLDPQFDQMYLKTSEHTAQMLEEHVFDEHELILTKD